jgi:hypothetical protein
MPVGGFQVSGYTLTRSDQKECPLQKRKRKEKKTNSVAS